ncbi:hypothetical protein COCMIDRAFT_390 [Bipolaris oryzae ATCC 44560]|uniref:Uncharacterized protein n=1 Tax=Bipolaris oryzae ATCC 44560 TaxID=930090 RepID=W6ZUI7_COCMI|nr:uncharacterized protein COCMIDRAFT_390 [Bipolaris oryzae ATCC 44560]EUC51179.1 hypothetical protein COCMIDRAFT_390 [Bipolaris oryzae ATCC 44560]
MQHLQATPIAVSRVYSHDARQWLDISGLRPPQRPLFPYQPQYGMLQPFAAPMMQYQQLPYQQYVPQLQMQQIQQPQPQQQLQQQQQQQQLQQQQQQQQQQQIFSGTKRNHLGKSNSHEEQPPAPKKLRLSSPSTSSATTTTTITPAKRGPGRPTNASKGLPTKRPPRKSKSKTASPTITGQNQAQPLPTSYPASQPVPFHPAFQPPFADLVPAPVVMTPALEREIDAGVRAQMASLEMEAEGGLFKGFIEGDEVAPVEVVPVVEEKSLWDDFLVQGEEEGENDEDALARAIFDGLANMGGQEEEEAQVAEEAPEVQEDKEDEKDSLFGDDPEDTGAGAGTNNDDDDRDSWFGDTADLFE